MSVQGVYIGYGIELDLSTVIEILDLYGDFYDD